MKKIIEFARKYRMFEPGMKILCAVSGGADSMFLLRWLITSREQLGISVAAAHYDHGLRGEESGRDREFVEKICSEWGIPLISERGNVAGYAAEHHLGTEEAARILRYEFLERAAEKLSCDRIATAHQMEDNAETILLNLTRGSGSTGLSGIPPVRGKLIRPLLCVSREEIAAYLSDNGIPHREDSSNASDDYSRNRIRHHVMPVLKGINPDYAEAMLRTGELLRGDEEELSRQAEQFISEHYDGGSLPSKELTALPFPISSRVIRRLCIRPVSFAHVRQILEIAGQTENKTTDIPGMRIRAEQGKLIFDDGNPDCPLWEDTEIVPGTETEIPSAGIRVKAEISVFTGKVHGLFKPFYIKCDEIYGSVYCTPRKSGDRIRLAGRDCSKSLKKLFTEAGLTQRERALVPVFRDERGVLAAYGFAEAERTVPSVGDPVLKITVTPTMTRSGI